MKKIRALGYSITGGAQLVNILYKDRGEIWLNEIGFPQSVHWLALLLSVVVVVFATKWIYDKWLWRVFFPGKDLNGKWRYTNNYSANFNGTAPAASNRGEVTIVQNPDSITFTLGDRTGGGAHWRSQSVDFEEDGQALNMIYSVTRTTNGFNETKTSTERLTIVHTAKRGLLRLKKPTKMISKFRNVMVTKAELAQLRMVFGTQWEPEVGDAVYERV